MKTFRANTSFRVVPEMWEKLPVSVVTQMFNSFEDWFILNEESMSPEDAEEAWKLREMWKEYINNRVVK